MLENSTIFPEIPTLQSPSIKNHCLSDSLALDGQKQGILGIALPVYCLLGILGNFVNLTVFLDGRQQPSSPVRINVIAVTIAHIFSLTSECLLLTATHWKTPISEFAIAYILWPSFIYGFLLSLGFTLAMALRIYRTATSMQASNYLRNKKAAASKQPYCILAIFSLAALLICLPMMFALQFDQTTSCYVKRWPDSEAFVWYSMAALLIYNVPCVTALTCVATMLAVFLCRQTAKMTRVMGPRLRRVQRERNFTIAVLMFLLYTWSVQLMAMTFNPITAPAFFDQLGAFDHIKAEQIIAKLTWITAGLVATEYSVTFVFHFIVITAYRESLLAKLRCLFCCSKQTPTDNSNSGDLNHSNSQQDDNSDAEKIADSSCNK